MRTAREEQELQDLIVEQTKEASLKNFQPPQPGVLSLDGMPNLYDEYISPGKSHREIKPPTHFRNSLKVGRKPGDSGFDHPSDHKPVIRQIGSTKTRYCVICKARTDAKRYQEKKETINAKRRAYWKANKDRINAARRKTDGKESTS